MKKSFETILLSILVSMGNIYAQLDFKISTNKTDYVYGETIYITCTVSNNTDSTINILLSDFKSCQAEFKLDNFKSYEWTTCFPLSEELIFYPKSIKRYYWTVDPNRFGLPDIEGSHKLVGYYSYELPPYSSSNNIDLLDSLYFNAPVFLGGQLVVGFPEQNDSLVSELKDSLEVTVIQRDDFPEGIVEIWQVLDIYLDSLYNKLENDKRLDHIQYNRKIQYDSISAITEVESINGLIDTYYLSDAYPNPFNPSTTIRYRIPEAGLVTLKVYDVLGREVATLVNEEKLTGSYEVEFDGSNLSSGVYFYQLKAGSFIQTRKMICLK
jgi:hypothetical protein